MTVLTSDCEDTSDKPIDYSYLPELVGHLLGLAHVAITQLCTEVMEPLKLTPKQFVAMEFISKNPCISQKNIAENIGTAPAVMVGILDDLSKRGLLKRKRSPHDRREYYVQLTPKGLSICQSREKCPRRPKILDFSRLQFMGFVSLRL